MMNSRSFLFLSAMFTAGAVGCFAQPNRIGARIDSSRTVALRGHVHPLANARNDIGAADSSLALSLTLVLKPTASQQSGLEQLIQQQQNPASTTFHQWLTPEQYGDRFGASASDTAQIATWLWLQGFTVDQVARSRTSVSFSGSAAQVQRVFGASIHRYRVNGESHYANATDPKIPAALSGMVASIHGLNDFHPKPHLRKSPLPQMTTAGTHQIAPDDFTTIYDVTPMYGTGINGSGQSVAIVGQSALYNKGSDITAFWNKFNLTSATLVQKLVGRSPGVVQGDVDESSLDIEWASAVARNATIVFVYSSDVWKSATYAVDQNLAPVLSMSYGLCEMFDLVDLTSYRLLVQQANSQGITWVAASGDNGAADCDAGAYVAEGGLAVDEPASIPEVTAMGGTMFNESGGSYWNTGNVNGASAKGYIPEVVWNETSAVNGLAGSGGGASLYFAQPSWQTTAGVPNDGMRHVPDLSFSSATYHDGYYLYSQASSGYVGGTSVATPTMAGVVALLNQYLISNGIQTTAGLGNINPTLYRLAQTAPSAFHDVTGGSNSVPCADGSPDCNGDKMGWAAGSGYDSATGLGSVDVTKLILQWTSQPATGSLVLASIDQNPVYQQPPGANGNQWTFQLTLNEEAGIGTTLKDFTIDGISYAAQIASLFKTASISPRGYITASYSLSLATVPKNVTFGFSGADANGTTWSTALTTPFLGVQTHLTVAGVSNAATGQQVFAPGMIMAVYGVGLGNFAQAASTTPLPNFMAGFEAYVNNIPTPLYYVSANQVNLQIPYETGNGTATLSLGNPYETVNYTFTVTAAGPGIFTFADGSVNPSRTGSPGQEVFLFITGEGLVTPTQPTGTSPSAGTPLTSLPKPRQNLAVTVGGVPATVIFKGIPSGLVGVTQINFTIPPGVTGVQPVVVTIGTAASPPAYITVGQ